MKYNISTTLYNILNNRDTDWLNTEMETILCDNEEYDDFLNMSGTYVYTYTYTYNKKYITKTYIHNITPKHILYNSYYNSYFYIYENLDLDLDNNMIKCIVFDPMNL
jgi:hypothetical protein